MVSLWRGNGRYREWPVYLTFTESPHPHSSMVFLHMEANFFHIQHGRSLEHVTEGSLREDFGGRMPTEAKIEKVWSCYGGCHVTEIVSLMEGEWSCYRDVQVDGHVTEVVSLMEGRRMVMLHSLMEGEWSREMVIVQFFLHTEVASLKVTL